eukprot:Seg2512.2 transcript_id=Seg2512.2/GoldUCD/mRNA.D3Y31 product="hypothetical protein" protein_id=Seg2512.2/GoldUCD/D3Y31
MIKIKIPSDMNRVPSRISTCYKRFKADEWKHWTLIYSLFCLKGLIPDDHYAMWTVFVASCRILCRYYITRKEVADAHHCLKIFGKQFEKIVGKDSCTPNMHLHLHLKQCILNFGQVYAFWCFSFERYNGILGKYHVNNHEIASQIMREFIIGKQIYHANDLLTRPEYASFLHFTETKPGYCHEDATLLRKQKQSSNLNLEFLESARCETVPAKSATISFSAYDAECVTALPKKLHCSVCVSDYLEEFTHVTVGQDVLTSTNYCGQQLHCSSVLAGCFGRSIDLNSREIRPAILEGIFRVTFFFNENGSSQKAKALLAKCFWLRRHERNQRPCQSAVDRN